MSVQLELKAFDKSSLKYVYQWNEITHSLALKNTLDRTNGYEVLYFINDFFASQKLSSLMSFSKTEYLIYNHLPINVSDVKEVQLWLLKNWDKNF